jgi:hypothetical protein
MMGAVVVLVNCWAGSVPVPDKLTPLTPDGNGCTALQLMVTPGVGEVNVTAVLD